MSLRLASDGLFGAFPALAQLDLDARDAVVRSATDMLVRPGTLVFEVGQPCLQFLFIEAGCVRVHLLDPDGHEIVLYRLKAGDTCILTMAALLGHVPYAAYAVTETEVRAASIPADLFDRLVASHPSFRRFVFASHAGRIADLIQVVTDVAFTRIGVRLAQCLLRQAGPDGCVHLTHDALAVEIGSAREVVSRNLKTLERQGFIERGQGHLCILNRDGLANLASGCEQ